MVNRNTGFTPNFLQLEREVQMPADVMFGMLTTGQQTRGGIRRGRCECLGGAEASENVL